MFKTLFIILTVLAVIEYLTTAYGILSGKAKEINPFLKWMADKWLEGMFNVKLIGTAFVFYGVWTSQEEWLVIVLGIPLLVVCVWNIRTIIKSRNINI